MTRYDHIIYHEETLRDDVGDSDVRGAFNRVLHLFAEISGSENEKRHMKRADNREGEDHILI